MKIENHTKSLPGTRTYSPTKDGKVPYNACGVYNDPSATGAKEFYTR